MHCVYVCMCVCVLVCMCDREKESSRYIVLFMRFVDFFLGGYEWVTWYLPHPF
jgi:hypothetical protein